MSFFSSLGQCAVTACLETRISLNLDNDTESSRKRIQSVDDTFGLGHGIARFPLIRLEHSTATVPAVAYGCRDRIVQESTTRLVGELLHERVSFAGTCVDSLLELNVDFQRVCLGRALEDVVCVLDVVEGEIWEERRSRCQPTITSRSHP
jgi:hypothetical protein